MIISVTNSSEFGVHGYDYTEPEMHPYFMAVGPAFKQQTKVEPFHSVDLFNVFTAILQLPSLNNNGTTGPVAELLRINQPKNNGSTGPVGELLGINQPNYEVGTIILLSGRPPN